MAVQATGVYTQKPVPETVINGQPAPGAIRQPACARPALPCGRANHDAVRRNRNGSRNAPSAFVRSTRATPSMRARASNTARRGARRLGAFLPDLIGTGPTLWMEEVGKTITSATTSASRRGTSSFAAASGRSRSSPDRQLAVIIRTFGHSRAPRGTRDRPLAEG